MLLCVAVLWCARADLMCCVARCCEVLLCCVVLWLLHVVCEVMCCYACCVFVLYYCASLCCRVPFAVVSCALFDELCLITRLCYTLI